MSSSTVNIEDYLIPLEEIVSATRNFSSETQISHTENSVIYEGQLSERWQNRRAAFKRLHIPREVFGQADFLTSVELMCRLTHENINSFIGYCDEANEKILVSEYENNQSLWKHLEDPDKRRALTWVQRLQICLGAATGLEYIHFGLGERRYVTHKDIVSSKLLLNDDLETKICSFNFSTLVDEDRPTSTEYILGTSRFYWDPLYKGDSIKRESDVFSFGVVMFEVLSGMFAEDRRSIGGNQQQLTLIQSVRRYYDFGLDDLIDPLIRDQICPGSFRAFKEIAYQCISLSLNDRPSMITIVQRIHDALEIQNNEVASNITMRTHLYQNLESLAIQDSPQICVETGGSATEGQLRKSLDRDRYLIPLEEILLATDNFSSETVISQAGTNVIFGGQLSERWQNRRAAFTRLNYYNYFGQPEFLDTVDLMCILNHENINPFIGYCDEADEMIIVEEYANNQSLYQHLADPDRRRALTWVQRLKICLGAATGLEYLHWGLGEGRYLAHRHIRSSKLLLNDNLEAKICNFKRSRLVDEDTPTSIEYGVGERFYWDPLYKGCSIKRESDVFSFGVVMFEVLSGMFAKDRRSVGDNQQQLTLIQSVRRYFDFGLDDLVDPFIRDQISPGSFRAFTEIAYQCISLSLEDRPSMNTIVQRIHEALKIQNNEVASNITMRTPLYQNLESLAIQHISPQICIGSGGSATDGQVLPKWLNRDRFLIPLEEILSATDDFSSESEIEHDGNNGIYVGQLSERWQNRRAAFKCLYYQEDFGQPQFLEAVDLMIILNHENIIRFIGYCDEADEMIIVEEYANNQSLRDHLADPEKRRSLTWAQRLEICLGAAAGLEYLHSGLGEGRSVLHRQINSKKFLLDDNLEAKACSFDWSLLLKQNQPPVNFDPTVIVSNRFYVDPIYQEGGKITVKSEIYSFGVVLFEALSGMLANEIRSVGDNQQQTLISLVRRYYDDGLDNLIDPYIRGHINIRSFRAFRKIAYQCISWNSKDRPTMSTIINRIQEALDIQNHEAASLITIPSHQNQNTESFVIPLEEILLATQNFSKQTRIGGGETANVYRGQLSKQWQNRTAAIKRFHRDSHQNKDEFRNELQMISIFRHENVISFIGYCDEANDMIIVYDYAINSSLHHHLFQPEFEKRLCLTWAQRLQICIGAARGIEYLHWCVGEDNRVIHRDIRCRSILLDGNLEAKISDFALSLLVDRNQQVYNVPASNSSNPYYRDPIYVESGLVNTQSDIYSFGVLMLEMLSGTYAFEQRTIGDDQPQALVQLVRQYYHEGLDMLIDPVIRDEINMHSFRVFIKTVYLCLSLKIDDRPTIKRIIKRLEEARDIQKYEASSNVATQSNQGLKTFQISLEDIKLATKDFNQENFIGGGGFGKVYQAQHSGLWQNCKVAIKCLDPKSYQGRKEFLNEIKLLSSFHHRHIISFVGYCDEGGQMIIVSKYAVNGSLDHHLGNLSKSCRLTWVQRLKICLGAAKALDYLHSGLGNDNRVIHRDIKSGNILLDENMEAKICDFGLSRKGPKNQEDNHIHTGVVGTNFYTDPLYRETNELTKESDVYSFGVVLFEMLHGILAYVQTPLKQHLLSLVRKYYYNEPQKLIDPVIKDEIDNRSFHMFVELAFRCISLNSGERPTMDRIIDRIEDAIDFQGHEV